MCLFVVCENKSGHLEPSQTTGFNKIYKNKKGGRFTNETQRKTNLENVLNEKEYQRLLE